MIISDRFFYNRQYSLFVTLFVFLCLFFMSGNTWAVSSVDVNIDVQASGGTRNLVTDQGTTGGPLTINRVELFFTDNQLGDITVSLNEEIKALAKIKYTGNGTLQWQWLVDGRVIQQGSRGLIYGSSLEITTDSIPPLPTFEPGQHHVSFRIVKPLVHFTIPPITYFVDTNTQLSQSTILLYSPTDDSWTKRSQLDFSWSPLPEGVLYQIDIWPLNGMSSESKFEDYRNQSSNKNLNAILQAQTRSSHYKPNPTQLELLQNERLYEWQISAINEQGEVLAESVKRLFRIRPEYDQNFPGGIFFRSTGITGQMGQDHSGIISAAGTTSSVVGSFRGRNAASYSLLEESKNISYNVNVTGGQTIFINPRVENSSTHNQQNLTIEIKNENHLIGRRIIPVLPAHSYFQLSHAWGVPILENQGQLTVTILEKETLLDQATINWKTETTSATSGLNFKEVVAIKPQTFPDLSCGVSTPFFVETITPPADVLKKFPTLSSKLISARVTTMEKKSGERQEITDKGWFNDDEESSVSFIAEVTDNGFMDAYLRQKNLCGSWLRDMKNYLDSIANKLSPQPTHETLAPSRNRQLAEQICSGKTGMEKVSCLESVSNSRHIRFSDEELEATADELRRAATFFDSKPFPDSFSLFFEIATATTSDKPSIIWKDSKNPIELRKGDQKTRHISSPIELPGTPGEFNVSISGISPQSPLYTTLDGGLPRFLEMAGFTLEVQEYYRQPNGALSGYAKTYWHGNLVNREIPLVFHDLTYTNNGSPLYAKVTSGQAELKGLQTPLLGLGRDKEHSYPVILKQLELLADQAKADISFKLPEKFHAEEFSQINFTDVDILNGGEFLAEYQFPKSYKDMDIARGDLDIRLAGSYILADFSEHISNSQVSQEPTWQGIILSGGAIRARVRERSDHPELGLMPAANRAYILGRFSRLELSSDGKLHGDVQLVSPTTMPAFFDQPTNHQIELLSPFDFKLEFLSGVFQISDDGVGGIDLAGRLTLPEEYDSAPLRFSHLTRLIVGGKPRGFHSENITNNLPELQLSGIPYNPESAMLIIPASLDQVIATPETTVKDESSQLQPPTTTQISRESNWEWPQNGKEMSKWIGNQRAKIIIHSKTGGLILDGGTFDLPWPEVPTPVSETTDDKGEPSGTIIPMTTTNDTRTTPAFLQKLENGVFCLDSNGINGSWIQTRDRKAHLVGDFTANLDGVRLEFQKSSLVNSLVEGALVIPYPTLATLKFTATLDDDLQIILNDEGLKTPEEISLTYWHATLHPRPRLHLDRSGRKETIHIESASLRLDVADEFGGQEFMAPDQEWPFQISLDILPDGNIHHATMAPWRTQPTQTTNNRTVTEMASLLSGRYGANLLFLGHRFQPEALFGRETPFSFHRYHGKHQPPTTGSKPGGEVLITITGKVSTSMFGDRGVKIQHTAQGAQVPYIEQIETGITHRSGIIKFATQRLRFVNSYPLNQEYIDALANNYNSSVTENPAPSSPLLRTDSFDSSTFKRNKSFVGLTEFSFRDVIKGTGLSEAGIGDFKESEGASHNINTCRKGCAYEKIGFGYGVDVGQAALDILHIGGTAAETGGAAIELVLNLEEGVGTDIIDLSVEGVSLVNDFITFYALVAGDVAAAGTISPGLIEELRGLVNDGLQFVKASLSLSDGIYIHNFNGSEYDIAAQGIKIGEIIMELSSMAVRPEDIDPDRVMRLLAESADQILISLITIETSKLSGVEFGNFGRVNPENLSLANMEMPSIELIALNFGRLPVLMANKYLKGGEISPTYIMEIMHKSFDVSLGMINLLKGGSSSQSAPNNFDANLYSVLEFALRLANQLTDKSMTDPMTGIDTHKMLQLLDTITEFICEHRDQISQGLGQAGVDQTTRQGGTEALAASRLVIHNLHQLNEQLKQTNVIPKEVMVKTYILPIIDTLLGKSSNTLTPCSQETSADTEDCGALPHIGNETKFALMIVKETLSLAMTVGEHPEQVPATKALDYIKHYVAIFEDCDNIFHTDLPFAKINKNLDDLIRVLEPLEQGVAKQEEAKAALDLANVLMQIFEERADSMSEFSLDRQSRALLHTLRAVDNAGLTAIEKGNGYQPKDAIHSSRKILTQIPKFVDYGSLEYYQLDTGTAVLSEVLALIEKKNGEMNTLTADETLALAERALNIVKERMGDTLEDQDKKNIQICLMVLNYSRLGLSKLGAGQKDLGDLFAAIQEILPSEKELLAYMQAISQLLDEGKKNPDKGGQEGLAQLIRSMVEQALAQGISPAAEKELRLALLYLNQIKNGNCQFLYTVDDTGDLSYIKTTCDDGITREFNTNDNLLTFTFPTGSQRYPYGGIEKHRVSYNLDIAPYRVDLSKPAGDPDREQALQNICQRLNPEDFDSATLMSLQSKTETGRVVSWKAIDGILKIVQESSPSCQSTEIYSNVLNMPSFNSAGSPNISENYQLVGRTWYNNEKTSCFQWQQDNQHINRFWDNGNKTSYLYHGLTGQYPELDIVTAHKGNVVWGGKHYTIAYLADVNDPEKSTLEISDPASGSTDTVWVDTTGTTSYQFNPDNTSPPQHVTSQKKTIIATGHTDVYDFEHQLFWRKTTPVELWEFYQMADTLPHPDRINVGQPPAQNIAADPQSYTLLVSMDGETAHNPDGTPLTEPLELSNGVTLRPGSLHISIDGIDFHSISNHVTSDMVNGLAVEKVTLESGMIMSRWTDNDGVKHLKEEVPGIDGSIRLEIHTEELTDGSVRETTTNRMQLPATYIRRVRRGDQVERWTWKEGEQPAQHGEITTLGHYVTAIDNNGTPITAAPELSPANIGAQMAVSLYLTAESVITALPGPTSLPLLVNVLEKINNLKNMQSSEVSAENSNPIPNPLDIPGVRERISHLEAAVYNNYIATLLQKSEKTNYSLPQLRGKMNQCEEIKTEKENGHTVPECTAPAAGATDPLAEIVIVYSMLTNPQNYTHLQVDETAIFDSVSESLGQQYRMARAAMNNHDTPWNKDLVIKVMNTARQFGPDVYQKVCGSDNPPELEDVVIQRSCLTASQAIQHLLEQSAGQALTPMENQRLLAILQYNQQASCPTREDLEQHPEYYPELSGDDSEYNPDNLNMDIILPTYTTSLNDNCGNLIEDPTMDRGSRIRASLCSDNLLTSVCFCDHSKLWWILHSMDMAIKREKEKVEAGGDNNITFFESQAKLLKYFDNLTKGVSTAIPGIDSGLFGPETSSQEAFNHFCEKKYGMSKTEYNAQSVSMCSESIIQMGREDAGGEEGTSPDFDKERKKVEQAIDKGIAEQERQCLENQDTKACANAEKHRKKKQRRTQAVAKSTSKKVDEKVNEELGSFCAAATASDEILIRLKYWQQVYHDLHKQGINNLSQYDTLVNLWVQNVVADVTHNTIDENTIKRVRCAINLAATLGVLQVTGPMEEFIAAHKDEFLENLLYAAGWPIFIHVVFDSSDLVNIDIDTSQGKQQLINMIKEAYSSKRQTMFSEKTPLSLLRFNNISLAVSAMADKGVLFNRTDFFSGLGLANDDPQSAISDVLNQAITSSSHCLIQNQIHCGMEQVKQLLSLAATAQTLGHNPQALLATTKAKEIIEQMFNESAVADIDFGEIRLLLENILKTGDACHDNVVAIMASLYQGMTEMGTELVNHLAKFGAMMAALQLDIPDFQTQIIPDLMAHLPEPPPQLLDCAERLRLALLHLKKGMELSHPSDAGYPFAKLAQAMGQDFAEAVDPEKAAIAGRAALRAASLLAERLVNQLAETGESNGFNVEEVRDLLVAIITGSIQQAAGLADQHQAEIKTVLRTLQESTLLDSLIPGDPNAISTIILKASLNQALATALNGLEQESVSNLEFNVSAFLHDTQDKLREASDGGQVAKAMEIPLAALDFLLELNPQAGLNDDMAVTIVQYVGQAMQKEPVTGFVQDADPRLVPLVQKLGNILQNANRPDFPTYAVEECVDFAVSSIWPNQPIVAISLNWATNYLLKTYDFEIEDKLTGINNPDYGIADLITRMREVPDFAQLNLPTELFTIPTAAMISVVNNYEQLISGNDRNRTSAIFNISADTLNAALPAQQSLCNNLHPLACMVQTIGQTDELFSGVSEDQVVDLALSLLEISENWASGSKFTASSFITPIKNIAAAGSPEEILLTALVEMPDITQKLVMMVQSAPPQWQKYLNTFSINCGSNTLPLSPPDKCVAGSPFTIGLAALENIRMDLLHDVYNGHKSPSNIDSNDRSQWGYLKTMPIIDPPEDPGATLLSMLPVVDTDDHGKMDGVEEVLVAYIDYGRMLLNLANSLGGEAGTVAPRNANIIKQQSIFSELIGEAGDFYSGYAGGMLISGEPGQPMETLALETIGSFTLPAIGSIAGQFTVTYAPGSVDNRIRGGLDIPDFANLLDALPDSPTKEMVGSFATGLNNASPLQLNASLDGHFYCGNATDTLSCAPETMGLSLDFTFDANIMGKDVADITMSGNLNAADMTGDLCLESTIDLFFGLEGFSPLPLTAPTLSVGGGLWHHPGTSTGTGFSIMGGMGGQTQASLWVLGKASLTIGLETGLFTTLNGNSLVAGSCASPYLDGSLTALGYTWKVQPDASISGFPKIYKVDGKFHHGLGFTAQACHNTDDTDDTDNPDSNERTCDKLYLFIGDETQEFGFGDFPARSGDKPWGGLPEAASDTCNHYSNCATH